MQKNGLSLTWVFHDWEFFDNFDNWWMEKFCGEVSHESKQSVKNYQNVSSQDSQSAVFAKAWLYCSEYNRKILSLESKIDFF